MYHILMKLFSKSECYSKGVGERCTKWKSILPKNHVLRRKQI